MSKSLTLTYTEDCKESGYTKGRYFHVTCQMKEKQK